MKDTQSEMAAIQAARDVQRVLAGRDLGEVIASLGLLLADSAVNACPDLETAHQFVDRLAHLAKNKLTRDWREGKAALAAARQWGGAGGAE
ncbi:hypothetical protein [Breoghania corrubedonensis]|uniref:hypothetical protein n=1 Tax=Breoghania corrubedonensis TaxID=665038 RepID=UPI0011B25ABF|nr:hypothetical protein [Breoghania corrubedonensis]